MKYIGIFSLCLVSSLLTAHQPDKTYSTLQHTEDALVVTIEFPWTIQQALQSYYPELEDQTLSNQESNELFRVYVASHFRIYQGQTPVKAQHFRFVPATHGHSTVCELQFPQIDWKTLRVENQLLFNIHPDQENQHTLVLPEQKRLKYVTHAGAPVFAVHPQAAQWTFAPLVRYGLWTIFLGISFYVWWLGWQLVAEGFQDQEVQWNT